MSAYLGMLTVRSRRHLTHCASVDLPILHNHNCAEAGCVFAVPFLP